MGSGSSGVRYPCGPASPLVMEVGCCGLSWLLVGTVVVVMRCGHECCGMACSGKSCRVSRMKSPGGDAWVALGAWAGVRLGRM